MRVLLIALFTQNFIQHSICSIHKEFKQLTHSKLRQLYAKHYDGYLKFLNEYKKGVEDDRPEPHRLLAYAKKVEEIKKHNALYKQGKTKFKLGLNKMADMTEEDLNKYFPVIFINETIPGLVNVTLHSKSKGRINWVTKGYVSKVQDNRMQDECFGVGNLALAVAGAAEAYAKKRGEKLRTLSAQELLDCSVSKCVNLGRPEEIFSYIIKNKGLMSEKKYPFGSDKSSCRADASSKRYGKPGMFLTFTDPKSAEGALSKGPVVSRILATAKFIDYKEGIFEDYVARKCLVSHTVLVVGYTNDYFLIKNSWGTDWGENGYMRISRDPEKNCNLLRSSAAFWKI